MSSKSLLQFVIRPCGNWSVYPGHDCGIRDIERPGTRLSGDHVAGQSLAPGTDGNRA